MLTQPEGNVTIASILDTIRELNQIKDVDMILDRILFEARKLANADAGSIYLLWKQSLVFSHVQNDTLFGRHGAGAAQYTSHSLPITGDSIVGYSALTKDIVAIDDAYAISDKLSYGFNSSFDQSNNYHTTSILTIPLITYNNSLVGVMQLINAMDKQGNVTPFSEYSKTHIPIFTNNATATIERSMLNRELILRMVKMAELHDPKETGPHVLRVSAFSAEIYQRWAEKRNLPSHKIRHFRDLISLAAMLHDAGKVGISDTILKKPGRLTTEEFDIIKQHTLLGAGLFTNMSSELDMVAHDIALHHHEKWDGSGYPGRLEKSGNKKVRHALSGEEIPLAARVTGLADVFDALCSKRYYKEKWDVQDAFEEIRRESGKHFDPELVEAFFEITDILEAIQEKFKNAEDCKL